MYLLTCREKKIVKGLVIIAAIAIPFGVTALVAYKAATHRKSEKAS